MMARAPTSYLRLSQRSAHKPPKTVNETRATTLRAVSRKWWKFEDGVISG